MCLVAAKELNLPEPCWRNLMRFPVVLCAVFLVGAPAASGQSADQLIAKLQSPDAKVRRLAAVALGKQKTTAAIPALAELLKDKEYEVRDAAGSALARIGPKAVAALVDVLKNQDGNSRHAALRALASLGPNAKEALPALVAVLHDKDVDVRIHAAAALGKLKSVGIDALPALFEASKDPGNLGEALRSNLPSSVMEAATNAALEIDPKCTAELAKGALPALIATLQSKDAGAVQGAVFALGKLGQHAKPAVPALEETLKTAKGFAEREIVRVIMAAGGDGTKRIAELVKNPVTPLEKRLGAIWELQFMRTAADKVVPILIGLLKDKDAQIRAAAVDGLSWFGADAKDAIPALIDLLEDEKLEAASRSHQANVVPHALSAIGSSAVGPLAKVLQDEAKSPFARWQAAEALAQLGRKAKPALPVLAARLNDKFPAIGIKSACAYVRAGGDLAKAMPVLLEGLQHETSFMAWHAADAIDRIGLSAREAVPNLLPLLKHKEPEVRVKAAHTLAKMGVYAKVAVPEMAKLLQQSDSRQRYQIARALVEMGPYAGGALPALIERLKDLEPPMSPHPVLVAIGNIGPDAKEAVPALLEVLKGKETIFHGEVMIALGKIGPEAHTAVPQLVEQLKSATSRYMRRDIARALGGIGPMAKDAVPALKKVLEEDLGEDRIWAAFALARIGGDAKPCVALLIEMWNEEPDEVGPFGKEVGRHQYTIAHVLDLLGADAAPARDLLLGALLDEKTLPGTFNHVVRALGHLGDADVVVPKLMVLLNRQPKDYSSIQGCVSAAHALGMHGPAAKAAIPRLRELLEAEEIEIAEAAALALKKIEGK
jgi:HEAT repeat protein